MRKCLAPFFLGEFEGGLDAFGAFDVVLDHPRCRGSAGQIGNIVSLNQAIRDFVAETLASDTKPFVLCGDCLSAIGCLAGLQDSGVRPDFLLWFDAHGDFHTHESTLSGHLGGMPLAMITGRGAQDILNGVGLSPFPDERICHVGARDVEPGEAELLNSSRVLVVRHLHGALRHIPPRASVWVHFDTDYINPSDAPAMRYPAPGGPRAPAIAQEFRLLTRRQSVIGLSVSAWAPHLDLKAAGVSTANVCRQVLVPFRDL
jgi:arginase